MSIRGTETEKNLLKSFAGESQARMRYTYFAEKAREEGYEQIANIFIETAENEKEHSLASLKEEKVLKYRLLILLDMLELLWKT